jgi:restriction endonuclease
MEIPVNTGISYEILVQLIFQDIVDAAATLKVQRNVALQGKTLKHQIDVYWEFEFAGVDYKTVVQAKDWNKPVDQGELLKFKSVLDDLADQPRGVFVTRTGYQSGAAEYARANGILLFELTEWARPRITITTLGWAYIAILGTPEPAKEGRPQLVARATPYQPKFDKPIFEADPAWQEELPPDVAAALFGKSVRHFADPSDVLFYDACGNVVGDLDDVYRATLDDMRKSGTMVRKLSHHFSEPTFLATELLAVPRARVRGFSVNISIETGEPIDFPFELPNIVTFILRNLSKGTTQFIQGATPKND